VAGIQAPPQNSSRHMMTKEPSMSSSRDRNACTAHNNKQQCQQAYHIQQAGMEQPGRCYLSLE
jgi:hypothetical protein